MKALIISLVFCMVQSAMGEVSTRICKADGNTPLELADPNIPFIYQDVMVGTKLTLIISSDIAVVPWDGALFIADANRDYGVLSARDYNETTWDWAGSRFKAAGSDAVVWDWANDDITGFEFYGGGGTGATAGDWYIIDYTAIKVGDCNVGFYDYSVSYEDPNHYIKFSHVRTRDFNNDTKVDFGDFAILASYWQSGCHAPDWCSGADLDTNRDTNTNGRVDYNDLMLFSDYWLETTQ